MSNKKTIQINPELFKIPGSKTKTRKDKQKNISLKPVISPNNLKQKLLKRIKDHKESEIQDNKKSKPQEKSYNENSSNKSTQDEFGGALNFLSDLTKKQKNSMVKQNKHQKTLKTQQHVDEKNPQVFLDLPPELDLTTNFNNFQPKQSDTVHLNYKTETDVPYGCLKNGKKKTYREWKQINNTNDSDMVRPPTPPKKNIPIILDGAKLMDDTPNENQFNASRSNRLEQIKNKLKKIEDKEMFEKQNIIEEFKKYENKIEREQTLPNIEDELNDGIIKKTFIDDDIDEMIKELNNSKKNDKVRYIKTTTKRNFTLGKSDKLKRVSVLLNNKKTRKNIIDIQRELKKTPITDIKKYLREHGISKIGSICPNDILRQTYESLNLSGDVYNINKETMLHNFLSDTNNE